MEEVKNHVTAGTIARELLTKEPDSRDPIEIERVAQKDYLENLTICVANNKDKFPGDFYIVVLTKNEKLMPNVFRNYFAARLSCPTPDYDQSLFKYNKEGEQIEYIWTIPSKEACLHLKYNANEVVESERQLLKFVLEFFNGTLDKMAKNLNKELPNSLLTHK